MSFSSYLNLAILALVFVCLPKEVRSTWSTNHLASVDSMGMESSVECQMLSICLCRLPGSPN